MILDYSNAKINIEYEYDKYNKNDTDDNTSDDTIDKVKAIMNLTLVVINSMFSINRHTIRIF